MQLNFLQLLVSGGRRPRYIVALFLPASLYSSISSRTRLVGAGDILDLVYLYTGATWSGMELSELQRRMIDSRHMVVLFTWWDSLLSSYLELYASCSNRYTRG
jgi:hypothetical protein